MFFVDFICLIFFARKRAGSCTFRRPDATDIWLASSKAPRPYYEASFRDGCWLFFGKETRGLSEDFLAAHAERCLRLPMLSGARCLNLSNSVAVFAYEALRQIGFPGFQTTGKMSDPQ